MQFQWNMATSSHVMKSTFYSVQPVSEFVGTIMRVKDTVCAVRPPLNRIAATVDFATAIKCLLRIRMRSSKALSTNILSMEHRRRGEDQFVLGGSGSRGI